MKKLFTTVSFIIVCAFAFSQAPQTTVSNQTAIKVLKAVKPLYEAQTSNSHPLGWYVAGYQSEGFIRIDVKIVQGLENRYVVTITNGGTVLVDLEDIGRN